MEQKVLDLVIKRIDDVKSDLDEVRQDVKTLLEFKYQIVGGSVLFSAALSIIITFSIEAFLKR